MTEHGYHICVIPGLLVNLNITQILFLLFSTAADHDRLYPFDQSAWQMINEICMCIKFFSQFWLKE